MSNQNNQTSTTTFKLQDYVSPSLLKIIQMQDRFDKQVGNLDRSFSSKMNHMSSKVQEFKVKNIQAFNDIRSEIPLLGRAMDLLSNPIVAGTAAAIGIGTALFGAGKAALEFNRGMAKANVTAQLSKEQLKGVSDQVLEVGRKFGGNTPLGQIPDVFNKIISAGLDVNTSLATLGPTLLAAKAGFTDAGLAGKAAVSVMNSSGIMDATRVYDILFATLNKGNAEFEDIAQVLPRVIPDARALGYSLEETAGAFSFLTAQGRNAENAGTSMTNVFNALANPERIAAFEKLGVAIFKGGKRVPLLGVVEQLNKALNKYKTDQERTNALSSLGLDMQAKSALATLIQDTAKYSQTVDFVTNSTGQLAKAVENAKTEDESWLNVKRNIATIWQKLGEKLLPTFEAAMSKVNVALEFMIKYGKIATDFLKGMWMTIGPIVKLLGPLALGIGLAASAMAVFNAVMALNPIVRVAMIILALAGAFNSFYQNSQGFRAALAGIGAVVGVLSDLFIGLGKIVAGIFNPKLAVEGAMQFSKAMSKISAKGFSGIYHEGENKLIAHEAADKIRKGNPAGSVNPTGAVSKSAAFNNATGGTAGESIDGTSNGASGSGRNVTVNIGKLIDKVEIHMTNIKEGTKDIERMVTEALIKAVRDGEIALSTD